MVRDRVLLIEDDADLVQSLRLALGREKYRVEHSEKAKVASDTRKALAWLQRQWNSSTKKRPVQTTGIQLLLSREA